MKTKKPTLEDQLAVLAAQHSLYPTELFQALLTAKEKGKSALDNITVEYRGSVNDQAIFLIKKDDKVVAQFRVPEETLLQTEMSFDSSMATSKVRKEIAKQNPAPSHLKVEDLRVGMKKISIMAEVLKKPLSHVKFTRSSEITLLFQMPSLGMKRENCCFVSGINKLILFQKEIASKSKTPTSPRLRERNNYASARMDP